MNGPQVIQSLFCVVIHFFSSAEVAQLLESTYHEIKGEVGHEFSMFKPLYNNSAAGCSISLAFGTEFDTADRLPTFKVKGSKGQRSKSQRDVTYQQ